jgi:ferredoxin
VAKYKITHLKKDCISCGGCANVAQDLWKMDEDALAQMEGSTKEGDLWVKDVDSEEEASLHGQAADVCPVVIIKVEKNSSSEPEKS